MKKTGSKIIGVFAAIAAVVVLASSIVVTYPNEYKLIKQFGEIVDVVEAPGVSFKIPFIQESASDRRNFRFMIFRNQTLSQRTRRA